MSVWIHTGEHGPTIIALLISAIGWAGIRIEKRRRRRRAAAGLPIFGPARPPEGAEGTGPDRQSLPLSREVFEHFRAMGPGWQARIDEVLRRHVREEEDRARRREVDAAEGAKARVAEDREAFRGEG